MEELQAIMDPSSIVDYYESTDNSENIKARFDLYEKSIFERIEKTIRRNEK